MISILTKQPGTTGSAAADGRKTSRSGVCWLVATFLCVGGVYAQEPAPAQQLPDSARPGASPLDRQLPGFRLPELPGQVIDVPPVYDRPLAIEEGPRIYVKSFTIEGLPDEEASGIDPNEVRQRVEQLRVERQGLSLQDQELSKEELKTIADYYAIIASGRPDADRLRIYQALVNQIRDRVAVEQNKGLTLGQLEEIANVVTDYYREAGYFLATAILPQQTVEDGVVDLVVLEGKMGQVLVEGNERYSDKRLSAPFRNLVGEPVTQEEIEGALLTMSDYPGLTAFGVFRRGQAVGETDLSLSVQDERVDEHTVRFDNHGSETTGEYRVRYDYARNNIFDLADRFEASALAAFDPANTLFGSLSYELQAFSPDYRVGIGLSRNAFDVGAELEALDLSGVTTNTNLFLHHQFRRGREANASGRIDLAVKNAETLLDDETIFEDSLTVLTLEYNTDFLDQRFAGINQFSVRWSHGFDDTLGSLAGNDDLDSSRIGGSGDRAGGEFDKLVLYFARLQTLTDSQNLLFAVDLQWSDDLLVPLEQSSLGGPDNVRGYPIGEFLRDTSAFASLEWNLLAPFFGDRAAFGEYTWAEVLQFSVFYDYAWGEINDPAASDTETVNLASAGIGARLNVGDTLASRLQIAWPTRDLEPSNDRDPQYWLDVAYTFP